MANDKVGGAAFCEPRQPGMFHKPDTLMHEADGNEKHVAHKT